MRKLTGVAMMLMPIMAFGDEIRFGAFIIERFERHIETDLTLLDLTANYGTDEHQFVAKFEGEDGDDNTHGELQLLYSKPISPYFDLRLGVELETLDSESTAGAVVGFDGLAPYRIETELRLVVRDDGDAAVSGEFERDFLLTQKLIVQPRLELTVESGSSDFVAELRARYEMHRQFAPYVGVSWQKAFGDSAAQLRLAGIDSRSTTAVAGVALWF